MKRLIRRIIAFFTRRELWYINGPETLPPPLSREREAEVYELLTQGDGKAKELLITHNLRLVVYIAKKFENTAINVEDLVSIGTIGLIKAVNSFCPEKNIKFATYASRCIENEILMFMRKNANRKQELSIDEPLNVDGDGNELLVSDIIGTDASAVYRDMESETELRILETVVLQLPERERYIIAKRFGLFGEREHTQKEVAGLMGISQSYISRLEKRILAKLKHQIQASESA